MRLDDVLPTCDFRATHALWVHASPGRVYHALGQVTPAETPLFGMLFGLRTLPARLTGRGAVRFDPAQPVLDQFVAAGFSVLADVPEAELVVGRIAQFWKLWGGRAVRISGEEEFRAFGAPGYAKAALNFSLHPARGGTRLATETRIRATDPVARRQFGRYWVVIHLGSAAIRRSWLRAIKRRAEVPVPLGDADRPSVP